MNNVIIITIVAVFSYIFGFLTSELARKIAEEERGKQIRAQKEAKCPYEIEKSAVVAPQINKYYQKGE